jgi:hypothetical protein
VQFARNKKHPSSLHKFARTTGCKARRAPKYLRVQDRAGTSAAGVRFAKVKKKSGAVTTGGRNQGLRGRHFSAAETPRFSLSAS